MIGTLMRIAARDNGIARIFFNDEADSPIHPLPPDIAAEVIGGCVYIAPSATVRDVAFALQVADPASHDGEAPNRMLVAPTAPEVEGM
ncbi:hypothetical protein [Amycolatopsis pithecellobii]|uniref:Uncharacterized protein n=1 Tax=Amycolatopsis pithecellobii TaxID=664692 RepID=A0A6N7YUS7_9PSEU|nr:hypothetical protein [Amycolatopsis pithecellobii]MTD55692.1 hypothetical protein [Amycolatopsis pithecellobii]